LNALSIRIYWDGRDEPGVEAPLGEFFAVGQGSPAVVESFPVQVSPSGSLSCCWQMPFARSARIVITNDNTDRGTGLYWQVDWTKLDALPDDIGYFHTRYRQEYPAVMGQDYLIADIQGRGRYVGTVLSVTLSQDGWFGEGDDFFYIDGEAIPSLQGTGTEDYFNDAWGFRKRTGLWFGQPRWQGYSAGDSGVAYRWHIPDSVGFERSLRLTIEHKGNHAESEDGWFLERPDFLNSVAFWYQTGEPKLFGRLPAWPERCIPWQICHMARMLRAAHAAGGPGPILDAQGLFGGRPALSWTGQGPDASLTLPFHVAAGGRCAVRLNAFTSPESGCYDVAVDAGPAVRANFRASNPDEVDLLLGAYDLIPGDHTLSFRPHAAQDGPLVVEMLRLLKLPPEAVREHKTENEAHFFRLGIGRAVYAYRLAYGTMAESLQALVDAGVMDERYLHDENGATLACWRDGDSLCVESQGGWRHSWQGLDARR
jgi:hypothetical protein